LARTSQVRLVESLVEKVDPMGFGKLVSHPSALPGAAGSEEKERLCRGLE
jgi:hypothetical protein